MSADEPTAVSRPLAAVTGASSGIGREMGMALARRGYDLVIDAEDSEIIAATTAMEAQGAHVTAVRVDLRGTTGVQALHQAVVDDGRRLEVLALDAGVGQGGAFVDTDLATHRLRLAEAPAAYEMFQKESDGCLKVVLTP